jgi:uncharacterized membrane protein
MSKPLRDVAHFDYLVLDYTREKIKWRFSLWNKILIFIVENKEMMRGLFLLVILALMIFLVYIIVVYFPRKPDFPDIIS